MATKFVEKRTIRNFSMGQIIFKQGEPGHSMFIIVAGQVEVSMKIEKRKVVLAHLKQGDIFGEMALFGDKIRSATVIAETDVMVHEINRVMFNKQVEGLSKTMKSFFNILVDRLKESNLRQGAGIDGDVQKQAVWLLYYFLEHDYEEHMGARYLFFNKAVTDISFITNTNTKTIERILSVLTHTELAKSKTGGAHERVFLVENLDLFRDYASYCREKFQKHRDIRENHESTYTPLEKDEEELLLLLKRFLNKLDTNEDQVREDIFQTQLELQTGKKYNEYFSQIKKLAGKSIIKIIKDENNTRMIQIDNKRLFNRLSVSERMRMFENFDKILAEL